jgi:hypothetical protein
MAKVRRQAAQGEAARAIASRFEALLQEDGRYPGQSENGRVASRQPCELLEQATSRPEDAF